MTLVLPAGAPKKQSIGQRLSQGVGRGLEMGSQMIQEQKQAQQYNQENEMIKKLTGHDVSGIRDPKVRQQIVETALQGKQKEGLLSQKQDFLNQILKGNGNQNNAQGNLGAEQPQQNFDASKLSDEQIAQVSSVDPNMGRALTHAKDVALREKREDQKMQFEKEKLSRKEQGEISKPILLELNESRKNIPLQEQAILDIQEAAPNVSGLDYFADVTGFEPLRSAHGAKLKTAIKDFFLSDLTRAGARPNMWIEQQLADALPKIGRSAQANLITAEGMKFKLDLAKKRIEEIDKLAEQDRDKYGFVKGDIDSRAAKNMKKYVIDRQKELGDNVKKIKAENKGKKETVQMTSPDGSVYEILTDDIDEAIKHGFNHSK